ncbi:putative GOT1-membrane protein required for ER to Golgi transport [Syncephalis fuscata]|nr:putative GOT1-membrane protein required for ER to Golgi transport [Syncephalis fuscata]
MWDFSETQKIGAAVAAFGGALIFLGVLLLFDAGLIAIGNILLIAGGVAFKGFANTGQFFAQRRRIPGAICFFVGVIIVFFKWPIVGLIVEVFGFINLFADFFPALLSMLRRLPVIGSILNLPGLRTLVDRVTGTNLPV